MHGGACAFGHSACSSPIVPWSRSVDFGRFTAVKIPFVGVSRRRVAVVGANARRAAADADEEGDDGDGDARDDDDDDDDDDDGDADDVVVERATGGEVGTTRAGDAMGGVDTLDGVIFSLGARARGRGVCEAWTRCARCA